MKKIILLLALCTFTHAASATGVQIRKDTEVCKFNKTGKVHCYSEKHKSQHHKQKPKRSTTAHKKAHHKHKSKHHRCK